MPDSNQKTFAQGVVIQSGDEDFADGLRAAVDYRGDVTICLKSDQVIEGFLFNCSNGAMDVFPKNSPQKQRVRLEEVLRIEFSGKDEALGKSWEDWVKRRGKKNSPEAHA